jgi:predicted secreted protein
MPHASMKWYGRAIGTATLGVLVMAFIAIGCRSGHDVVDVSGSDYGKTAHLAPGDTLLVTLATVPGTGYEWSITNAPCLRQTGEPQMGSPPGGRIGAAQNETFSFEAEGPACRGELRLDYFRPWEKSPAPAKSFRLKISVK